jgi:hypothetical protein
VLLDRRLHVVRVRLSSSGIGAVALHDSFVLRRELCLVSIKPRFEHRHVLRPRAGRLPPAGAWRELDVTKITRRQGWTPVARICACGGRRWFSDGLCATEHERVHGWRGTRLTVCRNVIVWG